MERSSIDYLGGKNCLGKIWSLLQENYLTGGVRRRRKSQESLAPNKKFSRIDQESAATLSMMDGIGIKNRKFECMQPLDAPKSKRKFVPIAADLRCNKMLSTTKIGKWLQSIAYIKSKQSTLLASHTEKREKRERKPS